VQAVIDWFGPTNFLLEEHAQDPPDGPVAQLLGGPVRQNREKAAQASPSTYVSSNAPPFLIMHGDQDHTVPLRQSESFYAALKQAGVDVTFLPIPGAGHGFGGARPELIEPVRKFLRRAMK
jgi:dipeptidyl aminopeptidase/acylaminoacyl peptidase